MFKICRGKGFQITFENGWTVSVQFGPGNYCEGYPETIMQYDAPMKEEYWSNQTAEIAAWDSAGIWYLFDGDTVKGYQNPREVIIFMATIALMPKKETASEAVLSERRGDGV